MATFSFAYNIGDIVRFIAGKNGLGEPYELRGTINSILIGANEALYMIGTQTANHPVCETDIVSPIFSTKSFDVFYPGVEVRVRFNKNEEIAALVESAVISEGRLRYWLCSLDGRDTFQAEEACVRLANNYQDNIERFK